MVADEILTSKDGPVLTVTINRPERRNAMTDDTLDKLCEALKAPSQDTEIRVVVLRGAGQQAFCAGKEMDSDHAIDFGRFDLVFCAAELCPCPVIAMVYGYAIGGGFSLALRADICLAAENARFSMPMVKLGFVPAPWFMQTAAYSLGIRATKKLFLTGSQIDAAEAHRIGLVDRVVPISQLEKVTYELARELAGNAPLAVRETKALLNRISSSQALPEEIINEGLEAMVRLRRTEDSSEGRRAFAEKRDPLFKGK
ncbi:MAG: enoyl-CoA hydratase/isomerase family protein [Chloroflexi bacterium]|nr:enoyl-CoA hydratase/isomerase family protein [Chloroflexota bacterium]